jgi:hypothetical protein
MSTKTGRAHQLTDDPIGGGAEVGETSLYQEALQSDP